MLILRKFSMVYFGLPLVLIMLFGHVALYGGQQLPDNMVDTALKWINQTRAHKGLEILSIDTKLNMVAKKHSSQMVKYNILSDRNPVLGTPFERIQSSGLTDINNLVVVARAKTWALLQEQLESPENLSKILSPEMTDAGIGIEQDSAGDIWLTIHMVERAITFTQFTLSQSNDEPARRSITIKGNTRYKEDKATVIPPDDSNPNLAVDRIIVPDSNGNFEIKLTLGTATGSFDFKFYVQKDGVYKLKNCFSMDI